MKDSPVNKVKGKIMADIASGLLKEGEKLPSVRFLSNYYETGHSTVCKALADLAKMGIIELEERKSPRVKNWKGHKVAIVYASQTNLFYEPFWREFYLGINDVFSKNNQWKTACLNLGITQNEKITECLYSGEYSGCISLSLGLDMLLQNRSNMVKGFPFVQVSVDHPSGMPYEVSFDFSAALEPVKKTLAALKSVRCLFFAGYDYLPENMEKNQKYLEIVKLLKQTFPGRAPKIELVMSAKEEAEEILVTLTRIFKRKNYPNFCVAYTDRDAQLLFRAMHNANRKCPEDVMLLSYDNMFAAGTTIPSQTSIELHRREAGRVAAENMLALLEKRPAGKKRSIQAELITRESMILKNR